MSLTEALNRTLLLIRDHLRPDTPDDVLVGSLVGTKVTIVADERNLSSHSAQSAFVTAAILMARMGLTVSFVAPNVPLLGNQPPLGPGQLITSLTELGDDLLPDVSFPRSTLGQLTDLAIVLGDTPWSGQACQLVHLNADDWSGEIISEGPQPWRSGDWPFGALAAAALAAGEAFKYAMRKLRPYAQHKPSFDLFFAATAATKFDVAPAGTNRTNNLMAFDLISGGAITQSTLYTLARIPGIHGTGRVIEPENGDLTNLNRYMLMRRSRRHLLKAKDIATQHLGELKITPVIIRFKESDHPEVEGLRPAVLVGVDHIPTRWQVQRVQPNWLGIGATTHYQVVVSLHRSGWPCAGCAHPVDEADDGPIATISIVSFWAGLLLAALYARHAAGEELSRDIQYLSFCPLRPEGWIQKSQIDFRDDCPVGHPLATPVGGTIKIASPA